MAELVDAQVSEACCRKAVEVRFFSSAPKKVIRIRDKGYNPLSLLFLVSKLNRVREEFAKAITIHQSIFGLEFSPEKIVRLADYYELVERHNPLLHLVAPCSPEEFATRHILESLTLLKFLPRLVRFADVGSGAGLPSIPCLIAREDLKGVLIESKEKKARFLQTVIEELGMTARVEVVNRQFSEFDLPNVYAVTCRALDKFVDKLPQLLKWSGNRELLLFGGNSLGEALEKAERTFTSHLMPLSERRFLFSIPAKRRP